MDLHEFVATLVYKVSSWTAKGYVETLPPLPKRESRGSHQSTVGQGTDAVFFLKSYVYKCLPGFMYMRHVQVGAHRGQKRTSDSLLLEL